MAVETILFKSIVRAVDFAIDAVYQCNSFLFFSHICAVVCASIDIKCNKNR